jgi:3',5'-cyclic AMP phosphodiesterase CpdA
MDGDYTFGICLGDIVGWDHSIYPEYNEIMAKPGIDYRYVIGNHDMTNYGRSFETSMRNYEDMYGPAWYSFNVGKVHYIVLNDNFYVGRDYFYIGYLDERQLKWLERDLSYVEPGSRVIVSLHIQTTNDKSDRDAFQYGIIGDNLCNKPSFYSMLEPYRATILSGHSHTADFEQISDNIFEINVAGFCGAWWCGEVCIDGAPAGYKIFDFDGDQMEWIYKGCGHPLDYQMKVYADTEDYPGEIVANIWDYDPAWKVEYFEDGVKVCDMTRFKAQDPLAKELYKDPSSLKRTWVYAAPTENMFRAAISEGAKTLEVRVTDRFGREYKKIIEK